MDWVGLDVGGANMKLATAWGSVRQVAFPLWKHPDQLAGRLESLFRPLASDCAIAAAMTGELADCFASREQGVVAIARAVESASGSRPVKWFGLDLQWADTAGVLESPGRFAASNWLALGTFVARQFPERRMILVDIGTTTTDIIPLESGRVVATGRTDTERLMARELVYCGVERTPVCGLVEAVPYRGSELSVATEWFATTLDVFLTLGELPQSMESGHTADGRAATKAASERRLSRMVLAIGRDEFDEHDAVEMAQHVRMAMAQRIAAAIRQVARRHEIPLAETLFSGRGRFLCERVMQLLGRAQAPCWAREQLLEAAGNTAPALALARLAEQDLGEAKS